MLSILKHCTFFLSEWLTWRKTPSYLLPSSNLSFPGWSHVDSCLAMESRKRLACDVWLVTYCIPLPHIPALFMTSLTQTAGQKMAALTVVFNAVFKCRFLTKRNRIKNIKKLLCTCYVFHRGLVLPLLLCWNRATSAAILSPAVCIRTS